jgi:hypothetical protein
MLNIGDFVFLRPVKHVGEHEPFLQAHGALCDRVWVNQPSLDTLDSSVFQICARTRVHAAEQLLLFDEKSKRLSKPKDREHAKVQRGILQRVCKKEEQVNTQLMETMMGSRVKYGEAIQLRHRLSGKFLQSGSTTGNITEEDASRYVAITEPEHFAAFLSDMPSQATWFVILSSDLIPTEVVRNNSHVYLQVAKHQEYLSTGSPVYQHPNPLMHSLTGGDVETNGLQVMEDTMHEVTMTKSKHTWQLSLYNDYHTAKTASVSFGDLVNIRDTKTKRCLTLLGKRAKGSDIFAFEQIINVEQMAHASSYFVIERATREDFTGGGVSMDDMEGPIDEVKLRHFNSAHYLSVDQERFCLVSGREKAGVFKLHAMPSNGVSEVYAHLSIADAVRDGHLTGVRGYQEHYLDVDIESNSIQKTTEGNGTALFLCVETRDKQMDLFTTISIKRQLGQFIGALQKFGGVNDPHLGPYIKGCTNTLTALDEFVVSDGDIEIVESGAWNSEFHSGVSRVKQRLLREQGVLHELLRLIKMAQPYWLAQEGQGTAKARMNHVATRGIGKAKLMAVAALSRDEEYSRRVQMEEEQLRIIVMEEAKGREGDTANQQAKQDKRQKELEAKELAMGNTEAKPKVCVCVCVGVCVCIALALFALELLPNKQSTRVFSAPFILPITLPIC